MLELIERILKIITAVLIKQADKDTKKIAAANEAIVALQLQSGLAARHQHKCHNLRRKLEDLVE